MMMRYIRCVTYLSERRASSTVSNVKFTCKRQRGESTLTRGGRGVCCNVQYSPVQYGRGKEEEKVSGERGEGKLLKRERKRNGTHAHIIKTRI